MEEKEEIVWASALSCLFYFVCDRGNIIRKRLEGLDIRVSINVILGINHTSVTCSSVNFSSGYIEQVIKTLLEVSREHTWAMVVRCKLICMLTNMLYQLSPTDGAPTFLMEQINLLGGIDYICFEVSCTVYLYMYICFLNLELLIAMYLICSIHGPNRSKRSETYL